MSCVFRSVLTFSQQSLIITPHTHTHTLCFWFVRILSYAPALVVVPVLSLVHLSSAQIGNNSLHGNGWSNFSTRHRIWKHSPTFLGLKFLLLNISILPFLTLLDTQTVLIKMCLWYSLVCSWKSLIFKKKILETRAHLWCVGFKHNSSYKMCGLSDRISRVHFYCHPVTD